METSDKLIHMSGWVGRRRRRRTREARILKACERVVSLNSHPNGRQIKVSLASPGELSLVPTPSTMNLTFHERLASQPARRRRRRRRCGIVERTYLFKECCMDRGSPSNTLLHQERGGGGEGGKACVHVIPGTLVNLNSQPQMAFHNKGVISEISGLLLTLCGRARGQPPSCPRGFHVGMWVVSECFLFSSRANTP